MADSIKKAVIKCTDQLFRQRYENYFLRELKRIKSKSDAVVQPLSSGQAQEVADYFRQFGYGKVKTDWHAYIQAVTGVFSPKMIPDYFYHNYLERVYNVRGIGGWEDKAIMKNLVPDPVYPTTFFVNMNGYFFDSERNMISREEALHRIAREEALVIKPTRESGGGRGVALVKNEDVEHAINGRKNYIVQKRLRQSAQMAAFNPSSVNTEKILSFLFQGEVYILSAHMRVGAPDSFTDNASGGKGYIVGIRSDGSLEPCGMNIFGKKRDTDFYGNPLKNVKLEHHGEICELIRNAHRRLPYFGFVSWDWCVAEDGTPTLIEYNISGAEMLAYQLTSGPAFGEMTDTVLKDAHKSVHSIKYSRL